MSGAPDSGREKRLTSFPPLHGAGTRVLVLGSMPGLASLRAGQYYAHPRNAFWPIMDRLCGAAPALPYAARAGRLAAAGIAVWDVLLHCERPGSLDASIARASEVPNDLPGFVAAHPDLRAIALNGRTAEAAYRRHAAAPIAALRPELDLLLLPSTSPAHAARSLDEKCLAWAVLERYLAEHGARPSRYTAG